MFNQKPVPKKKDDKDFINRIVNTVTEETEKFGQSITSQVSGDVSVDQPDPIAQAMQQKTESEEIDRQNRINKLRKHIRTKEELEFELRDVKKKKEEQSKVWAENVERQFKIVNPGEAMEEKHTIPLTTKPRRGMIPGKPGTAKGESGPEVRKSKQ